MLAALLGMERLDDVANLELIEALSHAVPFLRRQLLHRIRIRKIPALHFALDETIEEAARVLELMRKVAPAPTGDKPE